MCLALYISSSDPLPAIDWDDSNPAFYLEKRESSDPIAKQFDLGHIYYAGSHQGCGCGFIKEGEVGEELEACQSNYDSLAGCLQDALSQGAELQLFSCWEGDQSRKPEFHDRLTPSDIEDKRFEFKERQLICVTLGDA